MRFTTNAEALTDTTLVFVLPFEHVADRGKCTLKLQRGDSTVEIFTDVEFKDLFLYDFISSDRTLPADDVLGKRVLDYGTVKPRPPYGDLTLDQNAPPHSSLGKKIRASLMGADMLRRRCVSGAREVLLNGRRWGE
jgi:hypothetical protein